MTRNTCEQRSDDQQKKRHMAGSHDNQGITRPIRTRNKTQNPQGDSSFYLSPNFYSFSSIILFYKSSSVYRISNLYFYESTFLNE